MAGKRSTPEQTVAKLRQVEVLTAQGKTVAEAVRAIGVTEPTYLGPAEAGFVAPHAVQDDYELDNVAKCAAARAGLTCQHRRGTRPGRHRHRPQCA